VPDAEFSGPDTGSNYPVPGATDTRYHGDSWTRRFADDEKSSGLVAAVLQHDYVGQNAKGVTAPAAIDAMLSPDWPKLNYPALYNHVLAHVVADRLPYRMTECNDYTGGVKDASDAFAAALWALDYLHWWAAHGCAGVNFHNRRGTITDTIHWDDAGNFGINPKACALKAFDLGGHGHVINGVTISNPARVNVDCYAVGNATNFYVTIINKTHNPAGATNAIVTIRPKNFAPVRAEYTLLESVPPGDCGAREATLGGAPITSTEPWRGQWTPLNMGTRGECVLNIRAASAAIVCLHQQTVSKHETSK
jgi:hypothetical protein